MVLTVKVQAEQTGFVIHILAGNGGLPDVSPVDSAGQGEQLRQTALQVEHVAVRGFQIYIAFGGGSELHEFVEIEIVNLQIGHDFQTPFRGTPSGGLWFWSLLFIIYKDCQIINKQNCRTLNGSTIYCGIYLQLSCQINVQLAYF